MTTIKTTLGRRAFIQNTSLASGVSSLTGKAVQSSRDKEARRLRSRDKIVDDKIKKNKARDETITGGAWYNPMNWGAKLSRASGFESEDQKLGLDGHEDQVSRDRYLASKEQKYGFFRIKNRQVYRKRAYRIGGVDHPFIGVVASCHLQTISLFCRSRGSGHGLVPQPKY
ncbi:hypothetical protein N9F74_00635 [Flavobacteriaceae bacterium]|nr:hypothetical protein [Flavobacteriaceae bacterium]